MKLHRETLVALALACGIAGPDAQAQQGFQGFVGDPAVTAAAVASVDAEIGEAVGRVERHTTRKAQVDAEIQALVAERATAENRMRGRVRVLYRITRGGVFGSAEGFAKVLVHVGRVQRLARIVRNDARALRDFAARQDALRMESTRVAGALEQAKMDLGVLQARKVAATGEIAMDASSTYNAGTYEVDAPSGYGTLRVLEDEPTESFSAQRGRIGMPIAGAPATRDAQREDARGLEFLVDAGTSVRAVAAGRVAFVNRYGAYGRMVIIDHGESYFTVYAGMGATDVRVGDVIGRGARLGVVGDEQEAPSLFFEVRRGTQALEPRGWLGI